MKSALKFLTSGIQTSVQDAGRFGYRDVGVPVSGPLDRVSFRLANALVGNPPGAAALEMIYQGPSLEVQADSVRIALVGGGVTMEVRSANRRIITAGRSARLVRGEVLRIGRLSDSNCAYLAIEGGIDVETTLGSRSTYARAGIGGHEGRLLRREDMLCVTQTTADVRGELALPRSIESTADQPIRVVLGPQREYFTDAAVASFLSSQYTVSAQADRMGFRLDGPKLAHAGPYDLASDGIVPGAIQVPGSGLPIVLMVDAPTTGGYPKIATVISADVPVLGRHKPGDVIRFAAVDVGTAESLRREQEASIEHWISVLRLVSRRSGGEPRG